MTPRRLASFTLVASFLVISGGVAAAQPYYGGGYQPPPRPPETGRFGFTVGGAIGPGAMATHCDGCDEDGVGAFTAEGHLGWMLSPRFGLFGDFWGTWHFTGDFTVGHIINTIAAKFWPSRILWLEGGIGLGVVQIDYAGNFSAQSDLGFAVLGGVGVELLSAPRFSVDLQLRVGATAFDGGSVSSAGLLVGLNWY